VSSSRGPGKAPTTVENRDHDLARRAEVFARSAFTWRQRWLWPWTWSGAPMLARIREGAER
jgi:hypothetical protein